MRFVSEGPDIPNDLIREWRSGEVIFLAGAGVSAPSKLPLFEGLALGVYKSLGDPLFTVLERATKHRRVSAREKVFNDANLPPDKRVEATLFFDRQYDRLADAFDGHEGASLQLRQLALDGTHSRADVPHDLGNIEAALGVTENEREDALLHLREKGIGQT
jgi:hypothetical protein